jgi:hypothetical protein
MLLNRISESCEAISGAGIADRAGSVNNFWERGFPA